jgi:uncharacterized membrane protein
MKKNMGMMDRTLRVLVALLVVVLYYMQWINGTTAIVLLIVAGVFILTSFIGICPLYSLLGWSSKGKNTDPGKQE